MKWPQISNIHKNCNFKKLEIDRPTASSLQIVWEGHVRNLLFHFQQLKPLNVPYSQFAFVVICVKRGGWNWVRSGLTDEHYKLLQPG